MTTIAILNLLPDAEAAANLANQISKMNYQKDGSQDTESINVVLYSSKELLDGPSYISKTIPSEFDTLSKMHNFIVKDQHEAGFTGFLHVVEDVVAVEKDLSQFIADIAKMMVAIKMDVWFNTVCDGMNYVYSKYNPRIVIEFDNERWKTFGLDGIAFTSHSNAAWIVYNMANYNEQTYLFNEQFTIRMFMIIEFLARRKALNAGSNSLCLMNMYPTVKSEAGVFKLAIAYDEQPSAELMKKENELFMSMGINTTPDNLIDNVLETLYNIFVEKA